MQMGTVMNAKDTVSGALAECYLTIGGNRYNFMQVKEFESKYEINIVEVPVLGKVSKGHKASGGKGTWSGTAHFNQSIMRDIIYRYKKTGRMDYFDAQVTNEDPTSGAGRQTIIHKDCLIDSVILAKFNADDEILDEEVSGTFEDFEMPEKFAVLEGMQ